MHGGIEKVWTGSHLSIAAIAIWFGANLMFQAVWMGRHGEPFEAAIMLRAMGPFAVLAIVVELVAWVLILGWMASRISNHVTGRRVAGAGGD